MTLPLPPDNPRQYSVAVCTRNRWARLQATLACLARQDWGGPWELLVVDNGSSDATAAGLAGLLGDFPVPTRALVEPRPGVAAARNRALVAATSPWLLFLDDDTSCGPGWLTAYAEALEQAQGVVAAGGRIVAALPSLSEPWLRELYTVRLGGPAGWFDLGEVAIDLPSPLSGHLPFGANMAIAVAAARQAGGFDEALGWGGRNDLPGEETELIERLLAAGGRALYLPQAEVVHHLDCEAVSLQHFLNYHFRVGLYRAQRQLRSGRLSPAALPRLRRRRAWLELRARLLRLLGKRVAAARALRKERETGAAIAALRAPG
jgi:glycosyltransferase involved in cell wall biosynthesis